MKLIAEFSIFGLIGVVIPYTIFDWQWWAWDIALTTAVILRDYALKSDL